MKAISQVPIERINIPSSDLLETLGIFERSARRLGYEVQGDGGINSYVLKSREKQYRVRVENSLNHIWGDGGMSLSRCVLMNGAVVFFERSLYLGWNTLSDDSMDYETGRDDFVALYREDALARDVFEEIKRRSVQG